MSHERKHKCFWRNFPFPEFGGLKLLAIHSGQARLKVASKLAEGGVYLQAVGDNRAHRLLPAALALQPY